MGYYCEINDPKELEVGILLYDTDEGCEKYIHSFWYESVDAFGKTKLVKRTNYNKTLYLCLEIDNGSKNHENRIRLVLRPELTRTMEKKGSVKELMKEAESLKYKYSRKIDEDAELLKSISPIIAGFGILACVQQGENPEPVAIAKDSLRIAKALIEELNKEIY